MSKKLPKGSKIGYGGKGITEEATIISTYDIGYGDGFFRFKGKQGKLCTAEGYVILPQVSMDCFSCVSQKERICVFNNAYQITEIFDEILHDPYEILTSLSPFIKRTVI